MKTLEKVEAALAMIFDKLIFAQRWLQEYREAFQVRYFAVRLYVAILRFWHHTWGWITKYHNGQPPSVNCKGCNLQTIGLVKLTLFLKNYETDYRDLENLIHDQARLLRDAAWSEAFSKIIQGETCQASLNDMLTILHTYTYLGVTNTDKKFDFSALLPRLTPRDGDLDHYRKHHKAQSSKYQKDTCRWIHDQEEFKLWRSTSSNVLWIYALPAWGKTVLAWYIIEYLLSARQPVLYFYCVHDNPAQSKAPDILRSLVLQILRIFYPRDAPIPTSDTLSDDIFTLIKNIDPQDYENHDSHSEPKFRELFEAVGRGQSVYIVLDGLDEAIDKEIESLLDFLGRFADEDDACIKLLAISRKEKFLQNRNQENRWIPSGND